MGQQTGTASKFNIDKSALMRTRMTHTRWAGIGFALLLPFLQSAWGVESAPHEIIEWFGYFLVIAGVFGRIWCAAYIGGRKNDELVDIGPYSVVRNPLYVFSFLAVTGVALTTGMLTVALLVQLLFAGYYRAVVEREEKALLDAYGRPYADYLGRVPRWLPRFARWREPGEIMVKPRFLYLTLRDIGWVILLFPVVEAIDALQAAGYLPVLLRLP
jgi:protein-S-isoprenylcysteine O-methyltransferase Ste14